MTRRKDPGKTKRKRRPPPPKPSVKSNAKLSAKANPQSDCDASLFADVLYFDDLYADELYADELYADELYADELYVDDLYADELYADEFEPDEAAMWIDEQGVHALLPGHTAPDAQMLQRMSETFQQKLRQLPLYQQLVQEYGPVKAEQIIQQCRAELR